MAITIDATIGGASANSYQALSAITAYAEAMSPADADAWADLTDPDRAPFAVRAVRILDTIPFPGWRASPTQALEFPRDGIDAPYLSGSDGFYYGNYYPTTIIPPCVLKAHAQLSVYLAAQAAASATSDPFAGGDAGPLSRLAVGSIDMEFRQGAQTAGRDYLEREILPILRAGNCASGSREVRLTR